MALENEIDTLIDLLDDSDAEVVTAVHERIIAQGETIVPALEAALLHHESTEQQERITGLIEEIRTTGAQKELQQWIDAGASDMLKGMYCVAKFIYHDIEYAQVDKQFTALCREIWLLLNEQQPAQEKVSAINEVLFKKHKLMGEPSLDHNISSFFIHLMLEENIANPISIALLYLCIAQRLNLPIAGVCLPHSLILAYQDADYANPDKPDDLGSTLFYINPALGGEVFGDRELTYYADKMRLKLPRIAFDICSELVFLHRLAGMLTFAYANVEKFEKSYKMTAAVQLLEAELNAHTGEVNDDE